MTELTKLPEHLSVLAGDLKLEPAHAVAFDAYLRTGGDLEAAAHAAGIHRNTLIRWRKQAWWKELHDEFIGAKLQDLHTYMLVNGSAFSEALVDVAKGNVDEPKIAGAMVKAAEVFFKLGMKPLLIHRPEFMEMSLKIDNKGTINILAVGKLTQEQILEISQSGRVPESVKEVE